MKNFILAFLFFLLVIPGHAQSVVPNNIRAANTLDRLVDLDGLSNADMLYGIPLPESKLIGDTYLHAQWIPASILLYDQEKLIEGFPMRYDIYLNQLEIKAKNGIKVLKGEKVKSFVWVDSLTKAPAFFVNAQEFTNLDNARLTGFFQVLTDGPLPLFKRTSVDVKKADYNVQLNVGSHDDKILKKEHLFVVKESRIVDVPSGRKKLLPLFGEKSEDVDKFIKANALTANKEHHLAIIFKHYNTLINN
jgi:hypothetical protein